MTKSELIQQINDVFKDVRLENGVGLWQAQGIDDYADDNTMKKLREKDEKNNWQNLPYKDLAYCNSSLSFLMPREYFFICQNSFFWFLDNSCG
jgi:hypothetical protein